MTPLEAIQAATRNAAEALGRTGDVGAIAVGRYGDMIAVAGDPLANIRLLETVPIVIKGGALVSDRRDAARRGRSELEPAERSCREQRRGLWRDRAGRDGAVVA